MVCDVGTKNFCYILGEKKELYNFEIVQFNKKKILQEVFNLLERLKFDECLIENQVYNNTTCIKIQTIIEAYCFINKIKCKKVSPKKKFTVLNLEHDTYRKRKQNSIKYGEEIIKTMTISDELREKISNLKKKDDFYDCLLMMLTD